MLFKLSLRNIKRSFSDYTIYFMTITLAVALFYVFNSINEQQVMLDLSASESELMNSLSGFMMLTSVVVSIVFFVLCLFANRFFIKRRKKEFGLYMSQGMGKGDISKLLLFETILIAIVALALGIGLGTLLSQGMASFTASLFGFEIVGYQFIFSVAAMLKTVGFFSIIFVLVLIFNSISISSYTLLELLTASKRSENVKLKNSKHSAIIFIISVVAVITGYVLTGTASLFIQPFQFVAGIILILVGTIAFYYTGMSFLITVAQKNKSFYLKNINVFNIRQISSKLTAAFSSVLVIHLMLFFTITILSASFSYKAALDAELEIVAPYDVSLTIYDFSHFEEVEKVDLKTQLETYKYDLSSFENVVSFDKYLVELDERELLLPYAEGVLKKDLEKGSVYNFNAIRYSDYVKIQKQQGKEVIELKEDETLILTNMSDVISTIKNLTDDVLEYKIGSQTLKLNPVKYQVTAIETENVGRTVACFVIPDELSQELNVMQTNVNVMYDEKSKDTDKLDKEFSNLFKSNHDNYNDYSDYSYRVEGITRTEAYQIVAGETTNILYIGIYLGIVFLVSSGAVIGLRQLSDAADEVDRYKVLRKIGATPQDINKSIFIQVLISFMAPLLLALAHSIFAINYITSYFSATGEFNLLFPATVTICMLVLIYGGYMIASYFGYKKIVSK